METYDGNYQIDGYIEFTAMGIKYKTIIECKHYKSAITREKVQVLHEKIQSLGAQKGILISTSKFQSGAMKYAKFHGIALIQLTETATNIKVSEEMVKYRAEHFNYELPCEGVFITKNIYDINPHSSSSNSDLEKFLTNGT